MTAATNKFDNATTTATNGEVSRPLFPSHQRELVEGSGLKLETIREAGIYSEGDRGKIAAMLNRRRYGQKQGYALVFPYLNSDGSAVLHRIKPQFSTIKNGRPQKYLSPTGGGVRLYIPPAVHAVLQNASVPLLITEGEKKTLKATQEGFYCVGLSGVDCWHDRNQTTLSADLARIAWKGREVYVAFDSDAVGNGDVAKNERQLAAALVALGAKVKIVRIPPGPPGDDDKPTKQGIDDFLVANDRREFQALLSKAEEPEPPEAGEEMAPAKDCDPATEAGHILEAEKKAGMVRLRFWRGEWWYWSRGCYRRQEKQEIRGRVVTAMNRRWLFVRSSHVSDVMEQLRAKAMLASTTKLPSWLGEAFAGFPADECLATKSEVLHLPSLVDRKETTAAPASPAFFTTSALAFDVDLEASRPTSWFKFLDALWGDDPPSIETLQQWFGYCLMPDTRHHKGLLMVGPKRSGKGTIARIQTALVGEDNIAAPTLAGLGTNFGLWPLIGKTLAIISDARLSGRADQAAVVERILSITGEDSITVDRKNLEPLTVRLPTRFLILSNELPRLSDSSGAIVSRFILLQTTRSWFGQEDKQLEKKLREELPGILLWAIEGWRKLREQGAFTQPDSSLEALGEMNDLASPVAAFVRDCCREGPTETVEVTDLWNAWRRWCQDEGREKFVGTKQTFGRDLHAACPAVRCRRPRSDSGRIRVYEGIGLNAGF